MNRKFLIAITVVFSAVLGLWIWTLAIPKNVINIGGSASVDPIMQRATNKYKSKTNQSFVYSSTGSTSGVNNLKAKVYQIGFISKEVSEEEFPSGIQEAGAEVFASRTAFDQYFAKGTNQGYHWVNFAKDAIVFIYNIKGTGFDPFVDLFSFEVGEHGLIDKTNNLLHVIYEQNDQSSLIKWRDLAKRLMDTNSLWGQTDPKTGKKWDELYKGVSNKIDVTPYSSTPGSGTLTSFQNLTGVEPGQAVNRYGNNGSIFAQVSASSGAFGFVNLAFAQEATKPEFKHLKTVIITDEVGDTWNIGEGLYPPGKVEYPLSRPFIAIFNHDDNNPRMQEILNFLFWLATDKDLAADYKEEGLKQILIIVEGNFNFKFWLKREEFAVDRWWRN